jgi:transcriptional repressor NrdR
MRCPFCASSDTRVVDSRPADQGSSIRRRRECDACLQRFTTYERLEALLMVRKQDGSRQAFQAEKVRRGIERALADEAITEEALTEAVADIEGKLRAEGTEVASSEIGRHVLTFLRTIDDAAYLRFASVYKDFHDARDFEREVAALGRSTSSAEPEPAG